MFTSRCHTAQMSGRSSRTQLAGRRLAIVLTLLLAPLLVLSGCASPAPIDPLTPSQRGRLRAQLLDRMWAKVRVQYPGVLRPEIGSTLLVADREWRGDVSDCMQAKGFTVTRQSEGAMPSGGIDPESYAVADYACSGQFVTAGTVSTLLSDEQYSALRDYYIGFVRPCLLSAGARSVPPPGESGFVGDQSGGNARGDADRGDAESGGDDTVSDASTRGWNPYQQIWASSLSDDAVRYLEQRCPPVPHWLSLAGE